MADMFFDRSYVHHEADDDDGFPLIPDDMFFDRSYVHHEFEFGSDDSGRFTQAVDALKASTTDLDLTGQIVWPGARFLCWYAGCCI
jgi:hypothetical protein